MLRTIIVNLLIGTFLLSAQISHAGVPENYSYVEGDDVVAIFIDKGTLSPVPNWKKGSRAVEALLRYKTDGMAKQIQTEYKLPRLPAYSTFTYVVDCKSIPKQSYYVEPKLFDRQHRLIKEVPGFQMQVTDDTVDEALALVVCKK